MKQKIQNQKKVQPTLQQGW